MSYLNRNIVISAALNPFESQYYIFRDIPTDIDEYIRINNINRSDITSILPRSCTLRNISSNTGLNFLEEVLIRIYDPNDPDLKYEIFYNDIIPLNAGREIVLYPNERDVKDYLFSDFYTIEIVLRRFRDAPTENIDARIDFSFDVR
jgi:hypothetical protein